MIDDHQKFRLIDKNNKNEIILEVNWDLKDEKTNQCQVVKVISPSGDETYVDRKELHGFLFLIGRRLDQEQLIPQRQQTIRNLETVLGIKATKDIKKGEYINVPVKIPIPLGESEFIGPMQKSNKIITPSA